MTMVSQQNSNKSQAICISSAIICHLDPSCQAAKLQSEQLPAIHFVMSSLSLKLPVPMARSELVCRIGIGGIR